MAYQLVMVRGPFKGHAWPVTATPLVFGRGADCDIVIAEAVVSRRQCQMYSTEEGVALEDFASRNPALVNGVPVTRQILRPGDEISLGSVVFIVTHTGDGATHTSSGGDGDTASLHSGGVVAAEPVLGNGKAPRTVHDLAFLYKVTHALSACEDMRELLVCLRRELAACPGFRRCWVARSHGGDLTFHGADETDPPRDAMREAFRGVRTTTEFSCATSVVLCTPVILRDVPIAVLAVEMETTTESRQLALDTLALLAHAVAPWITTVEGLARLRRENERLQIHAGESKQLVGDSAAMVGVREKIRQAAPSELNILITGETGTGKELAAMMCHAQSHRSHGPIVVVNCAAIPKELLESELFGYVKGAFTGAQQSTTGLIAQANGGTLFLDEIGDLSLDNQARILRVIESGTFRRVGDKRETRVDVRYIAATNADLRQAVQEGRFRRDLYYRLSGFPIHLPPLRERRDDIPLLANHFFAMAQQLASRPHDGFTPEALRALQERPWPGNVRELRNCVFRAMQIASDRCVDAEDVCDPYGADTPLVYQTIRDAERLHIEAALISCNGDKRQAAKMLGIGRSTLYSKIKEYGITL